MASILHSLVTSVLLVSFLGFSVIQLKAQDEDKVYNGILISVSDQAQIIAGTKYASLFLEGGVEVLMRKDSNYQGLAMKTKDGVTIYYRSKVVTDHRTGESFKIRVYQGDNSSQLNRQKPGYSPWGDPQ